MIKLPTDIKMIDKVLHILVLTIHLLKLQNKLFEVRNEYLHFQVTVNLNVHVVCKLHHQLILQVQQQLQNVHCC